ncbi:MAG: PDZ domain-containing protein [Armatimonadota bacterium]|nr:PDZ domain-containing protein [Armatimonadota bacterium]
MATGQKARSSAKEKGRRRLFGSGSTLILSLLFLPGVLTYAPAAAAEPPSKPAESGANNAEAALLPLAITGLPALELLANDYEKSRRFYVEALGFREEDAAGAEGERRCLLTAGPVRLHLREQPGRPSVPAPRAWLGVYPKALSEAAAASAGMKEPKGVLVDDLAPQSPAGAAGLRRGDIILAVEGKPTDHPEALIGAVRSLAPDKRALVTVWREGKQQEIPVTLAPSPFPDRLAPVSLRLSVRGLEEYYREALRRGVRLYTEPRETPDGGRVLELVDPDGVLVILQEGPAPEEPPAAPSSPQPSPAAPG